MAIDTYLSGHDETTSSGIDGDISSHEPNILELFKQLSVFLITQSFDRGCVYYSDTYLSGHDETTSSGIDGDISSHEPNILELFKQLSVFLITQSFDRSCVYHSLLISQRHGYCIPVNRKKILFVYVDALCPSQQSLSHVRKISTPSGLNHYLAADKVSCSKTLGLAN